METVLNVGLDLGSDCLKIAYAYRTEEGEFYGKLTGDFRTGAAMPAVAYYDGAKREWRFGEQVDRAAERSFVTVVKIKQLLSLLEKNADPAVASKNAAYYRSGRMFPKFFFPVRREFLKNFEEMVRRDHTFEAENTPAEVCAAFFAHVRATVDRGAAALAAARGLAFDPVYRISVVHAQGAGAEYAQELVRLVSRAFGTVPEKVFEATKALCLYARRTGILREGESLLLFDMGEDAISAAKTYLLNGALVLDGKDGHSDPLPLGGHDVDEAICRALEKDIEARETMGTPPFGSEGHISERGLHSKQYLLMKDIKRAKALLSRPLREDSFFVGGVPISICRDLYIQRTLTREEFAAALGIRPDAPDKPSDPDGIAERIAEYIATELGRKNNRDVKNIFLSGGLTETLGLLEYIRARLAVLHPGVRVFDYAEGGSSDDGFTILSNEDSVYAAAVGASIASLFDENVDTAIPFSCGTWAKETDAEDGSVRHVLYIFVDRGTLLRRAGTTKFCRRFRTSNADSVRNEEIFSAIVTEKEIAERKFGGKLTYMRARGHSTPLLVVGEAGSSARRKAEEAVDLRVMSGGDAGEIVFFYGGLRVKPQEVVYDEGVEVSADGRVTPYVKNASEKGTFTYVTLLDTEEARRKNRALIGVRQRVPQADILVRFKGIGGFGF